jgi:hypothetical protein
MSLSGSPTFIVGLYGGTSSSSLSLQTTTTIDDLYNDYNPGGIVPVDTTFANLPAGTPAYFQVQVYDSRAANAADAWAHQNWYAGESPIFQATPLVVPDWIYNTSPPINSTWHPQITPRYGSHCRRSIRLGRPGHSCPWTWRALHHHFLALAPLRSMRVFHHRVRLDIFK